MSKKTYNIMYDIGDTVFLVHDSEQEPLYISEVHIEENGVRYMVCNGLASAIVGESELSREQNTGFLYN